MNRLTLTANTLAVRLLSSVRLKFDLHVDAVIADIKFSCDLTSKGNSRNNVNNQGTLFTFSIEDDCRLFLQVTHSILYPGTCKKLFHFVPKGNPFCWVIAIHAEDVLLALPQFIHRNFAIANWRSAMWTHIMAQPYDITRVLKKVLVDILAKDDFFFQWHRGIEVDLDFASSFSHPG